MRGLCDSFAYGARDTGFGASEVVMLFVPAPGEGVALRSNQSNKIAHTHKQPQLVCKMCTVIVWDV